MNYLIDTNVLLRSVQTHHPQYAAVERSLSVLRTRKESLYVTTQNFVEFWAVATRPPGRENGFGMSLDLATKELTTLVELFPLLPESNRVFEEWRRLVTVYKVSGKSTHDARLVAAMLAAGVLRILTFNVQDFVRYREIEALHPDSILP